MVAKMAKIVEFEILFKLSFSPGSLLPQKHSFLGRLETDRQLDTLLWGVFCWPSLWFPPGLCLCSWTPWWRCWALLTRWSSWFSGTRTWRTTSCSAWPRPWRAAAPRSRCSTSTSISSARTAHTSCWMFSEWSLRSKDYSESHIKTRIGQGPTIKFIKCRGGNKNRLIWEH